MPAEVRSHALICAFQLLLISCELWQFLPIKQSFQPSKYHIYSRESYLSIITGRLIINVNIHYATAKQRLRQPGLR